MPESKGKEEEKVKVHVDGRGGLYVEPADVLTNPRIREKIRELNETGPLAKAPPKDSSQDN